MQTDTAAYEELEKFNINKEDIFGKERCNMGGGGDGESLRGAEEE
jgi:hypothetical protein